MSLEDSISKLADAINNLAAAYIKDQTLNVTMAQVATPNSITVKADPEVVLTDTPPAPRGRGRPPGSTNKPKVEAPAPVVEQQPEPEPEPQVEADEFDVAPPVAEVKEYTLDDARKALMALRDHDGGDKTRALDIMQRIAGVRTAPEIKPIHYGDVIEACKKAMAS